MKIVKKIRLELYPCYLAILVGANKSEIKGALNRLGIPITSDETNEFIIEPQDKGFTAKLDYVFNDNEYERAVFLIWLRQKPTNKLWLSIVAHECLHLTHYVFEHIGQSAIPFDDDEVHVYLFDYIFEKVLDIVRRKS